MVSHLGISFQQHFYPRNTHCLVYPYHWSVLTSRSDLCLHSCVCHEKDMKSVVCLLIFIPAKTPLGAPNWCGRRLESHCFAYHRKFNKVSCMGEFQVLGRRPRTTNVAVATSQGAYKSSQQWLGHSPRASQLPVIHDSVQRGGQGIEYCLLVLPVMAGF